MEPPPIEGYVSVVDVVIWAAVAVGFLLMHWRINELKGIAESLGEVIVYLKGEAHKKHTEQTSRDDAA